LSNIIQNSDFSTLETFSSPSYIFLYIYILYIYIFELSYLKLLWICLRNKEGRKEGIRMSLLISNKFSNAPRQWICDVFTMYLRWIPDVPTRDASFHRHTKMFLTITFWKSKQIEHFKSLNCSFCSDLQLCHWIFFLNSHFLDLKIWVENIFPNFFQIFKKKFMT